MEFNRHNDLCPYHGIDHFGIHQNERKLTMPIEYEEPNLINAILYADSNRGTYIPQFFAQSIKRECVNISGMDTTDILDYIAKGPDQEFYWDKWDTVLSRAEMTEGSKKFSLYQSEHGDLWLVPKK